MGEANGGFFKALSADIIIQTGETSNPQSILGINHQFLVFIRVTRFWEDPIYPQVVGRQCFH